MLVRLTSKQSGTEEQKNQDEQVREAPATSGEVEDPAPSTSAQVLPRIAESVVPVEVGPREGQPSESGQDRDYGLHGESAKTHDESSESLATSPMGSDIYESSYNVLSLMSSMQDTQDDEFALVVKESEGKSELESDFEWPSGPVSEVEIPPVSVAGVERSGYKGAYQWAMNKELTDLIKHGTFKVLPDLPKGEKAINSRLVLSLKSDKMGCCLLYTSPSPRDRTRSRMPSSA